MMTNSMTIPSALLCSALLCSALLCSAGRVSPLVCHVKRFLNNVLSNC